MLSGTDLIELERLGAEIEKLTDQRAEALARFHGKDGIKAAGIVSRVGFQIAALEKKIDRLLGWDQ